MKTVLSILIIPGLLLSLLFWSSCKKTETVPAVSSLTVLPPPGDCILLTSKQIDFEQKDTMTTVFIYDSNRREIGIKTFYHWFENDGHENKNYVYDQGNLIYRYRRLGIL